MKTFKQRKSFREFNFVLSYLFDGGEGGRYGVSRGIELNSKWIFQGLIKKIQGGFSKKYVVSTQTPSVFFRE